MKRAIQVTCAGCRSTYNLTDEQVRGLTSSILPCSTCNRFIKITACPGCNSNYAITFSSAKCSSYQITCELCARPFTVNFPVIKEAETSSDRQSRAAAGGGVFHYLKNLFGTDVTTTSLPGAHARTGRIIPYKPRPQTVSVPPARCTARDILTLLYSSFAPPKLIIAAAAVALSCILMYGHDRLVCHIFSPGNAVPDIWIRSFLSIMPFSLLFFVYLLAATVIAHITMDARAHVLGNRRLTGIMSRSIAPVLITGIIIFIAANVIIILFGLIPVMDPFLFALLFFPLYALSLCIILLIALGLWFYPPVIAGSTRGFTSPIIGLLKFIRTHRIGLAAILPLMTMITTAVFSALYLVHYGSNNLLRIIAQTILAEDGQRLVASIPPAILRLPDITVIGSDSAFITASGGNISLARTAAGITMFIVSSLMSIFIFALFISIIATISARIYVIMESDETMDTASRFRILLFLVLTLAGAILLKQALF